MSPESRYYAARRTLPTGPPVFANVLPYPTFTKPFGGPGWETGQGGVGWYFDAARNLALNDGTYGETQYLHQGFATVISTGSYKLVIEVLAHPGGQANFGTLTIYLANYSLTLGSAPGRTEYTLHNANNFDHFFFLVNGTSRIAIKSVEIIPLQ